MTYPATVLLGFGFSAMLVNALSFAAELIGDNKVSSLIEMPKKGTTIKIIFLKKLQRIAMWHHNPLIKKILTF